MSSPRGNYVVNSKGEILVGKPNFAYGTVEGYFSPQWKLYGLSERWNSSPILFEKLKEKMDRGETVEGYVHDIDHGTRRFWGGGKRLPKAKMYLDRSLKVNSPMKHKTRKKRIVRQKRRVVRRIVGNGVRTHNKEGQKLYVVLVRGVPLKYQPPFKPGIVYYTKGWAIKKARAFGGEVVSVSDFMKYQRDTRKRAIQLGYMPKEYLSESERKLVGNPGERFRVGGGYQTFTLEEAKKEADKIFRKTGAIVSIVEHRPTPQVKPDYKYGIYTGRGIARNPSREILSQKKELVRIASEVALNLINHFGPSYDGGYAGVANSPLLPRSIRAVIDTMGQPFDAPNAKNKIMYYPKSYDVQEWQKRGNMANHIWFGQTDKGHDEVIRKGIAIAKAGNVFKNRRRGLRRNPAKRDFYGDVYIGKKKVDTVFVRSISEGSKRERELDVMDELLSMPNSYELAWVRKPNGLYDIKKGFRVIER